MIKRPSRLKEDLLRYYRMEESPKRWARLFNIWRMPGLYGVITYRFGNWMRRRGKWIRYPLMPINLYLQHRMRAKWGIEIPDTADIGGGLVILHHGGIFIGPWNLVAGKNLTVHHEVTIGLTYGLKNGSPILGDNVTIAPGAKILGRIRVGNNVKIGPNAVVTSDIPDAAVVHMNPVRIVQFPKEPASTDTQHKTKVSEKAYEKY